MKYEVKVLETGSWIHVMQIDAPSQEDAILSAEKMAHENSVFNPLADPRDNLQIEIEFYEVHEINEEVKGIVS